jgi:hypothetical protein
VARLSKAIVLQRRIGTLAQVHPYRGVPDRHHEMPGWWATPNTAVPGCGCRFCVAAHAGMDVYLGWDLAAAAAHAELATREHEHALAAAA